MKLKAMLGLAVCVGSLGLSAPVLADIVDVTYTGTVSGTSYTGVFGAAETSLTGQTFTARYTFDTGVGFTSASAIQNYAYGGLQFGNTSPNLSASFTIGATTISFVGDDFGQLYGFNDGASFSQVQADAKSSDGTTFLETGSYAFAPLFPASITNPVTVDLTTGNGSIGFFSYTPDNVFYDNFTLTSTQMTIGSLVPEPETYAMLLAGLGLLGFAARRRKQKEEAAFA